MRNLSNSDPAGLASPNLSRIKGRRDFFRVGLLLGVICLLTGGFTLPGGGPTPANVNANPQTRKVLEYFWTLKYAKKENKWLLSGQFTDFGNGANLGIMTNVFEKTGQWPGLLGTDYADFGKGGITFDKPNQAAIAYWKQGGLVTLSAHMYNPANNNGGGLRDKGVDLAALLQDGTDTHRQWMRQLDQMAEGLKQLRDAGVVVLWRPFHEVNGDWFWWGAKDPELFIKVWRHMFDYYSNEKGLDNLIWVYGPNHGQNIAKYYAGNQYVDIIGLDAYTDFIDREHIHGYEELIALGKPFGFTEYGPHGPQRPPGDYDYRKFIEGIAKEFPQTCFFMSWNYKWSLATNQNTRELLNDPRIINRSDLPLGLTGK